MLFGRVKLLPFPKEAEDAVRDAGDADRKGCGGAAENLHTGVRFREVPTPVSVLETVNLSWDEVRGLCSEGRLPVAGVLRRLDILRTTEQVMPTDEQVTEWDMSGCSPCHLPPRVAAVAEKHRKGRLMWLLRTAAELEEEVRFTWNRGTY